jgi:hypothetical protein
MHRWCGPPHCLFGVTAGRRTPNTTNTNTNTNTNTKKTEHEEHVADSSNPPILHTDLERREGVRWSMTTTPDDGLEEVRRHIGEAVDRDEVRHQEQDRQEHRGTAPPNTATTASDLALVLRRLDVIEGLVRKLMVRQERTGG